MRGIIVAFALLSGFAFSPSAYAFHRLASTLWGTDLPKAVLQDAMGMVTILCFNEGMAPANSTAESVAEFEQAQLKTRPVNRYKLVSGGYQAESPLTAEQLVPVYSESCDDGVERCFPATKKHGEFVEIIYDVKKDLRCWVRLSKDGNAREVCHTMFLSLRDDGPIGMQVDLDSLLKGRHVRIYESPSKKAKSVELTHDYVCSHTPSNIKDWSIITFSQLKNGFGLLTIEECTRDHVGHFGWVPLRDSEGNLLVWPCFWCCGCC